MNIYTFSGRLPQDAEVKTTQGGTTLCSFSVGVKSGYGEKEKTNWINCVLWGKRAEGGLPQYLVKGQEVVISGELNIDKVEKDGNTRYFTKVNVDKLDLVGGKPAGSESAPAQAPSQPNNNGWDDSMDVPF